MTTEIHIPVEELRFRLHGGLYEPGDPEYTDACTLYNAMIEKRPRLVARCTAPDDVVAALAFAREHGMEVTVRGGGHSVAGACLCDGGLVLDVRGMRDVDVDPARRIARVGGGATWADVDRATQEHGLATTGGRVSTTGVAGLTMGGGTGWLERKHGFACDNLVGAELVTASGELIRADEQQNPDLLWALRGGGGNFGVVTTLELRLHPVGPEVLAGLLLHPLERGRELLALYRDVIRRAPESLGVAFACLTTPDEPEFPEQLRGQPAAAIAGLYAGPVEEGEHAMRELREYGPPLLDTFAPMGYADFQCSLDDPPGFRNYWTAENVRELPDDLIDTIISRWERVPPGASQLLITEWGGAVARVGPGHSPLRGRDAPFVVHPLLLWDDPADDAAMMELGRGYRGDLRADASGDAFLNFMGDEGAERVRAGFGDAAYERLARVKARWDPENLFRGNQNIAPDR